MGTHLSKASHTASSGHSNSSPAFFSTLVFETAFCSKTYVLLGLKAVYMQKCFLNKDFVFKVSRVVAAIS